MKALLGRKLGMTQMLHEDGAATAMTLIQAGPCTVTQIKTDESDGYRAVQLGFGDAKKTNKAQTGHYKKAKHEPIVSKEFKYLGDIDVQVGDRIDASVFESGDTVNVSGVSKGKGFAGTVKRHNFNTGPKSHGSRNYRKPGSIGSMYPQKIFKGKKMSGQMGSQRTTLKNLQVVLVDKDNNLIGVKGAVSGPRNAIVEIRGSKLDAR